MLTARRFAGLILQRSTKCASDVPHTFVLRRLGAPAVFTVAGEQVEFRTRKHLALLVRMALEPGKQFTRDYLADLLWPDAPSRLCNQLYKSELKLSA